MYIEEFEIVNIKINPVSKSKWENKLKRKLDTCDINLHWSFLKGTTFRVKYIKVKCDDCGDIHERRIRDLEPNNSIHYCNKCFNKGERNGMYGKQPSEKNKNAVKKWMEINGNPFTWESSKEKIKALKPWIKAHEANIGKKRSKETKIKQSQAAILAFKEGRRHPHSGWAKLHTKNYKGFDYQSQYELKFIKYLEDINKLNMLEPGPVISYIDPEGKERNYFIDFKLKDSNIVFEIKSDYYWNKKIDINLKKMEAASKLYDYYLILNNDFSEIKNLFNEV
jgi:hypothetical protein